MRKILCLLLVMPGALYGQGRTCINRTLRGSGNAGAKPSAIRCLNGDTQAPLALLGETSSTCAQHSKCTVNFLEFFGGNLAAKPAITRAGNHIPAYVDKQTGSAGLSDFGIFGVNARPDPGKALGGNILPGCDPGQTVQSNHSKQNTEESKTGAIVFSDQFPGANAAARIETAAAAIKTANPGFVIVPPAESPGEPADIQSNISYLDLRTGTRSSPEANREFKYPDLFLRVYDNSPYSSDRGAQGDPGLLPIIRVDLSATGAGDPIPVYASAYYNSPGASNIQDSTNVVGALISAQSLGSDRHSGIWGLNVMSAIQNPAADQSMFGIELNSFNNHADSGKEARPLTTRRKTGFAATSSGRYASHDAFAVVSTTAQNTWHNGYFCQNAQDACFLAGEPGGGSQSFTYAFAAYDRGTLSYSINGKGDVSTQSGIITASYGNPVTVAKLDLTLQSGSVGPTVLYKVGPQTGSAMFAADYYLSNVVGGKGGAVILELIYTDENGQHRLTTPALNLESGAPVQGRFVIYAVGSTNIQYSTRLTGATGNAQYNARMRLMVE